MHNFINRLDAICHPFPGTHVLGVVGSSYLSVLYSSFRLSVKQTSDKIRRHLSQSNVDMGDNRARGILLKGSIHALNVSGKATHCLDFFSSEI